MGKLQHRPEIHCLPHHKHKILTAMSIFELLMPMSILGTLGLSIYFFAKVFTDYILKKKMIEKGFVSEETQAVFKTYSATNKYSSLKWGLLFFTGGLSLIMM